MQELSAEDATALVLKARASTRERVERLERELPVLRSECQELRDTVNGYREAEQRVRRPFPLYLPIK